MREANASAAADITTSYAQLCLLVTVVKASAFISLSPSPYPPPLTLLSPHVTQDSLRMNKGRQSPSLAL